MEAVGIKETTSIFLIEGVTTAILKLSNDAPDLRSAIERIHELASYPDNWDGDGAIAPKYKIIRHAQILAGWIYLLDCGYWLSEAEIDAMPNGTIEFSWYRAGKRVLSLETGQTEIAYFRTLRFDAQKSTNGKIVIDADHQFYTLEIQTFLSDIHSILSKDKMNIFSEVERKSWEDFMSIIISRFQVPSAM